MTPSIWFVTGPPLDFCSDRSDQCRDHSLPSSEADVNSCVLLCSKERDMNWSTWKQHFENNVHRPLPEVAVPALEETQHRALLHSLAKFQLGESGEGRIAHEIDRTELSGIDDDYRAALKRFIQEEGRHARILGTMVAALGGRVL